MGNKPAQDLSNVRQALFKIIRNSTLVIIAMGLLFLALLPFMAGYYENSLYFAVVITTALVVLCLLHRQRKQLTKKLEFFLAQPSPDAAPQGAHDLTHETAK